MLNYKCADLHCHTNLSDGSVSVENVVQLAKLKGLSGLSITDHDTIEGNEIAKIACQKAGIEFVKGLEISTFDHKRNRKIHLLCYNYNHTIELTDYLNEVTNRRNKAFYSTFPRLLEEFNVSESMLEQIVYSKGRYKQQVMHLLINAGYTTQMFGDMFNYLYGKEGICKYSVDYPEIEEVLPIVRRANGIAVVAHPRVYDSFDKLNELVKNKLIDGIEVSHSRNKEGDESYLREICSQNKLLATGGTDFHGMYTKKALPIATCTTDWETFLAIKNNKNK